MLKHIFAKVFRPLSAVLLEHEGTLDQAPSLLLLAVLIVVEQGLETVPRGFEHVRAVP